MLAGRLCPEPNRSSLPVGGCSPSCNLDFRRDPSHQSADRVERDLDNVGAEHEDHASAVAAVGLAAAGDQDGHHDELSAT